MLVSLLSSLYLDLMHYHHESPTNQEQNIGIGRVMPPTDPAPSDEAVFLCDRNVNEHTKEVDRRITLVGSKRLSVTSMKYDIDGDGVLVSREI